jgi:hypothetical protein
MFEQVLSDHQRILSDGYPQIRTARSNYQLTGDLARGMSAYEQVLADNVRTFGPDHPRIQMVCRVLAAAHKQLQ